MPFTIEEIKNNIKESDAWVLAAFKRLAESEDAIAKPDAELFSAVSDYVKFCGELNEKHITLLRIKMLKRYTETLLEIANSNDDDDDDDDVQSADDE